MNLKHNLDNMTPSPTEISKEPIRKGDIFYINADPSAPPIGAEIWSNRPGIVVSNDVMNNRSAAVEIVYLSTSRNKRVSPAHVPVISGTKEAIAMCEQIHTVDKSRVGTKIGHITDSEISDIEEALLFSLGINHGKSPAGIFNKWESYIKKMEKEGALGAMCADSTEATIDPIYSEKDMEPLKDYVKSLEDAVKSAHIENERLKRQQDRVLKILMPNKL